MRLPHTSLHVPDSFTFLHWVPAALGLKVPLPMKERLRRRIPVTSSINEISMSLAGKLAGGATAGEFFLGPFLQRFWTDN